MDQADIRTAVRAELDERERKREETEARVAWTAVKVVFGVIVAGTLGGCVLRLAGLEESDLNGFSLYLAVLPGAAWIGWTIWRDTRVEA